MNLKTMILPNGRFVIIIDGTPDVYDIEDLTGLRDYTGACAVLAFSGEVNVQDALADVPLEPAPPAPSKIPDDCCYPRGVVGPRCNVCPRAVEAEKPARDIQVGDRVSLTGTSAYGSVLNGDVGVVSATGTAGPDTIEVALDEGLEDGTRIVYVARSLATLLEAEKPARDIQVGDRVRVTGVSLYNRRFEGVEGKIVRIHPGEPSHPLVFEVSGVEGRWLIRKEDATLVEDDEEIVAY